MLVKRVVSSRNISSLVLSSYLSFLFLCKTSVTISRTTNILSNLPLLPELDYARTLWSQGRQGGTTRRGFRPPQSKCLLLIITRKGHLNLLFGIPSQIKGLKLGTTRLGSTQYTLDDYLKMKCITLFLFTVSRGSLGN